MSSPATLRSGPSDSRGAAASGRYHALDGLRGVAAIAVMAYHYTQFGTVRLMAGAEAAVDLFFMLSGFVLMHSYAGPIAGGMRFATFLSARLRRLGPLYLAGLLLGLLAAVLPLAGPAAAPFDRDRVVTAFALNLVLLPYLGSGDWQFDGQRIPGPIFPLNDPSWSLFFEIAVNGLFFAVLAGLRGRALERPLAALVAVAMAAFFVMLARTWQFNAGWGDANFLHGFPRVIAEFFLGALIWQHHRRLPALWPGFAVAAALVLLLTFIKPGDKFRFVTLFVICPTVILLTSRLALVGTAARACAWLGELSYPLYITHFPIHRLLHEIDAVAALPDSSRFLITAAVALTAAVLFADADRRLRQHRAQRRPR